MRAALLLASCVISPVLLCGCGTRNNPCVLGENFSVGPSAGTANHIAATPGNQFKFYASESPYVISGSGCALPALAAEVDATWTSSDPKDVSVSSAADETNGLATCLSSTAGAVTLIATASGATPKTGTVTLTCK